MRCAVSFLTVIILSIAVGLMALYIIWITENADTCEGFRCKENWKICINPKAVCNKIVDCPNKSDEHPITCNDFTTTPHMFFVMVECKNSKPQLESKALVVERPHECSYLVAHQSTIARGIVCDGREMNESWTQIPWKEFDKSSKIISIANGTLKTNLLMGQSDSELENSSLSEFPFLNKLYVIHNEIENVASGAFCHMEAVCLLTLTGNGIRNLSQDAFCPMMNLRWLTMTKNRLHLEGFQFRNMSSLAILLLDYNEISEITEGMFAELSSLKTLNISHNKIRVIHEHAFQNNLYLIELDLTENRISHLSPNVFKMQLNLTKLYISSNPIHFLSSSLFSSLGNLRSLNIESLDIRQFDVEAFNLTPNLDFVYFKKFSYCRYVPKAQRCYPNSDGLSSTSNLLIGQSRIMVWLVGLLTVLGNISVLANRWCRKRSQGRTEITEILNIFVTNLAIADFLMGVYLLILACKDVQFRGLYGMKAYDWGTSWLCSFIGIIAMISSEVSLLILTIMSLERYLTIGGPFSQRQNLNTRLARASMLIIWGFVCTLALAPAIQWQGGSQTFYGSTGLCFPIHLDDRYPVGWQYTTFIFIGVNSCCLILITVSYSMLFYTVRKTQRATPLLAKNIELASRFFLMVVTDVLCWAPIIILKAFVLFGYELPKEIIGWTVIYVLPLNSAVNPILYTFSTNEVRHAMTVQIHRILENFELNQLLPSQNHTNVFGQQGNTRRWFGRLVPQQRPSVQRDTNPVVVTGATEDSELTHSICPTIMTMSLENAPCTVCGTVGGGETMDGKNEAYPMNNTNYNSANASVQCGGGNATSSSSSGAGGGERNHGLRHDNVKRYNNHLSPASAAATTSSSTSKMRRSNNSLK